LCWQKRGLLKGQVFFGSAAPVQARKSYVLHVKGKARGRRTRADAQGLETRHSGMKPHPRRRACASLDGRLAKGNNGDAAEIFFERRAYCLLSPVSQPCPLPEDTEASFWIKLSTPAPNP